MINQVSVFVQNTQGRLASALQFLADANIDIRALSLADTTDFGILRLIVSDSQKAVEVLKANNRIVNETPVIAVAIDDQPGGLAKVTNLLSENNIDIQYMYAFVGSKKGAYVVLKVDDPDQVTKFLVKNNITVLSQEDIKDL